MFVPATAGKAALVAISFRAQFDFWWRQAATTDVGDWGSAIWWLITIEASLMRGEIVPKRSSLDTC